MGWLDDLFTVEPPTNEYASDSDNRWDGSYDPYPDTSLGGEQERLGQAIVQESLGRQIVEETQRGWYEEEKGRGIVQETLGQTILDDLLRNPDTTQPWFKGVDGSLAGVTRLMSSVGLLGKPDPTPVAGGVPAQLGVQPYFGPTGPGRIASVYPTNTTRDGRTGTLTGVRPVASLTGQFGGMDFIWVTSSLILAYGAYRLIRAL